MKIKNITKKLSSMILLGTISVAAFAGNPDRRGQNGATELLINPWARSSGLNSLNTASVRGLEAERLNVAGLAFTTGTEIGFSQSRWLVGTGLRINSFGVAQKLGGEDSNKGVLALTMMSFNFDKINITTTSAPDGGNGTYSPSFMNLGLSYAKMFSNSIYGGFTVRMISQSISDVSATGMAIDAGVQYQSVKNKVTGEKDRMKFGVSLRNVGTPMKFQGDGLAYRGLINNGKFDQTLYQRSDKFELPSLMSMGLSFDITQDPTKRLTAVANYTSNSFTADVYGLGLEYAWNRMIAARVAYQVSDANDVYSGLAAGLGLNLPMKKNDKGEYLRSFVLDYSYRATKTWNGTHCIGVMIKL